jgi:tetratricopeptide (TPR) repeat protein
LKNNHLSLKGLKCCFCFSNKKAMKIYFLKYLLIIVPLIIIYTGCLSPTPDNIEREEKVEQVTGYINFPKNNADIENNRRVEKKFINLAPMYGYANKDSAHKKLDREFVNNALSGGKYTPASACKRHCDLGWYYFKKGNTELACKRFNQAYLFDSTNFIIYWGFADIMGRQHRYEESFALFEKANSFCKKKDDSTYAFFCLDYSRPLFEKYMDSKQKEYVDKAFKLLDEANQLRPEYATTYLDYANLYFGTAQYQKSLDAYNKAVSLHSAYANPAMQKAICDSLKKH